MPKCVFDSQYKNRKNANNFTDSRQTVSISRACEHSHSHTHAQETDLDLDLDLRLLTRDSPSLSLSVWPTKPRRSSKYILEF